MARPTKLTPELRDRLVALIRGGCYAETAARAVGIAPSTYYEWLERGRFGGRRGRRDAYAEFADAIKVAEAHAERDAVAAVWGAMQRDWRAAIIFLERRFPARWRRRAARAVPSDQTMSPGAEASTDDLSEEVQDALHAVLGLLPQEA